ncbi:MAG: RNA polymerase factor sigma-54 [Ignavibacteriae bacterium]|nr:RNA polymerase factor sigma-54 [Ignavibacteriota bacterium]
MQQHLTQHLRQELRLTPQQVLYLKLLQLPVLSLEQRIKEELEANPLLEEGDEVETTTEQPEEPVEPLPELEGKSETITEKKESPEDGYSFEDFMNDDLSGYKTNVQSSDEDDDKDEFPMPAEVALTEKLKDQLQYLDITQEEELLGEEIIGNIDEDGYLRRELNLIVQDLNLAQGTTLTIERAERVLFQIQRLDPPGIAARSLQECLIAQLEIGEFPERTKELALKMLREQWYEFTLKHYAELAKYLTITIDELKQVIELISKLNPKPGEGTLTAQHNYIIPDFIVENEEGEFVINLNDRSVPPLRLNKRYKELMTQKKNTVTPTEVKTFIRDQFERAKWFINCIYQRRETMLKVMHTIVDRQREFFETGEGLRPMIYKDIAEVIGMDISTISRVVNGKYVQCEFGVFELRYFFSDKLSTTSGEDISNKEVKKKIKEIIEAENPQDPLSDDNIAAMLKAEGVNIARRTVAKYREAMRIPVARLRRTI